jgi:surface polysaccharide O-acyltransferase-like enzyme
MNTISPTTPCKEKYDYIDLLKAIAIYFVVIYHFNNLEIDFIKVRNNTSYLNYFIESILSTCVPIFFFVNGALLLNKRELDIKKHVRKIINIIILVIIWGAITLIALSYIRNKSLVFSIFGIIKRIFDLRMGWVNHLWFLEALIVIYIFLPLIYTTYKNNLKHFYFFFFCVMLLTFGNTLLIHSTTIISFLFQKFTFGNHIKNCFSDFNAFRGIFGFSIGYFLLGGILFSYKDLLNTKKTRVLSAFAILASMLFLFLFGIIISKRQNQIWDIVWNGYDTIFTLIIVVSIFIISIKYKQKGIIGKWVQMIGENSLGIYFLHVIIGNILKPLFVTIAFSGAIYANIFFTLAILITTLLIVLALKKVPIIKYLFMIT